MKWEKYGLGNDLRGGKKPNIVKSRILKIIWMTGLPLIQIKVSKIIYEISLKCGIINYMFFR